VKAPQISIVIPAYNEARRLPASLTRIEEYLRSRSLDSEVIVVDDGSSDGTAALVRARAARWPCLKLVCAGRNAGKGRAVQLGMAAATGKWRIFTDADLSVPIDDLDRLLTPLQQDGAAIAIASRALGASDVQLHQPWYRETMGKMFNRLVQLFVMRGIRDTQCGFKGASDVQLHQPWYRETMGKMFNRLVQLFVMRGIRDTQCGFKAFSEEAATKLFPPLQTPGFGFDVEVLYRARLAGFKIAEVPTRWINSPQSRVHPIRHSLAMFLELLAIPGRVKRYPS